MRGELLLILIFHLVLELEAGLGLAVSFRTCLVATGEMHWRFHLGEWLPPGLRSAREHYSADHGRAGTRFNVFPAAV
jgi:hypothetical protein